MAVNVRFLIIHSNFLKLSPLEQFSRDRIRVLVFVFESSGLKRLACTLGKNLLVVKIEPLP